MPETRQQTGVPVQLAGRSARRSSFVAALSATLLVVSMMVALPQTAQAAAACTGNEIACENQLPGTPEEQWDLDYGQSDDTLEGFATQISMNRGETAHFKIKSTASAYQIQIYRLGYYQGNGARRIADVSPSVPLPQNQPACATDSTTEIYDCGTWAESASWAIPATAVSGVYIARLFRSDTGGSSHIPFIVRNDASTSEVVYQTSDPTWQAYNDYGGSNFYWGLGNGRAYKVSYNRPFATRGGTTARDFLFSNEYPMIRFLESNGYDLSYISGLDTDVRGGDLKKHKTFLSVGHDEYWSANQRKNVEDARDAGVNLAFFSGNEVYWKTRWEPSQDGNNTANRTLVCYKDTWANTQIDPVSPTSTWRDPRMGVNKPENGLTGTIYMSNDTDLPITVNSEEGKLRLWRNTTLANQSAGASTPLAAHTVGYESDEDLDNGFRPPGLIRLSTTTGPTPQYLRDFGNTVTPGTTTHHLTMYKAASGALVFGAGTIQWAWGLDTHHDGVVVPADVRMRQATINILADMGATATTRASDLVAATKSADTAAPSAVISAPAAGVSIGQGNEVTVTGTATDVGGGKVAGVEVSLDGGSTWHPANGRSPFSYTGVATTTGSNMIKARAIDDSGNIQSPAVTLSSEVVCPCSIFGAAVPGTPAADDSGAISLGLKFTSSATGFITGVRFYKGAGNTGAHQGTLYQSDGTVLATAAFANETETGWQTVTFATAVPISAGETYVAAYTAPNGHYAADSQFFAAGGKTSSMLTALGGSTAENGVYTTGSGMPVNSYNQTNYWVDAVYSPTDTTPLSVVSSTPLSGSSSVPVGTKLTATFSRDPQQETINLTVRDSGNNAVSGEISYEESSRTVTFTPSQPLVRGETYQASVTASAAGVGPMAMPATWSFTTTLPDAVAGVCPCSFFNDADVPVVGSASDTDAVQLGISFNPEANGQVAGIRFYKGLGNTGAHTVSLWDESGASLASAPVTNETTAGWQYATFPTPVTVTAGTTYIASYRAPVGHYSYTSGGLAAGLSKPPLRAPEYAGRYTYGSGAPLSTSAANYFVDPVFVVAAGVAPQVQAIAPTNQSTSVSTSTAIAVTFDTSIQPGTATITVKDSAGSTIPGSMGSEPVGRRASFVPTAALSAGTTYTVAVTGAKNLGGTAMTAPATSTFTTAGLAACPCSLLASSATPSVYDSGDVNSVNVGMKFSSAADGFITGLRYYRDNANTGIHTGTLFDQSGGVLATLTFPNGDAGWQYAAFATAVPITAGTTYVASTFMPVGRYSYAANFFASPVINSPLTGYSGSYAYGSEAFPNSNSDSFYFVDVQFATEDPGPVTPAVVPGPPTAVSAVAGNGSATVTWSAPDDGGSPITRYTVTPYLGASAQPSTVVSGSSPATSTVVGGLTNGSEYTFTVTAANATGAGQESAPSAPVSPLATVPGAPSGVVATAGAGSATVSWTAPVGTGGSSLSSYTVTPFIGTTPQTAVTVTGNPPLTSSTVTGLTNGATYTFVVSAANAVGTGPGSAPSTQVTPMAVPGAPSGVSATPANGSATVSWTAPADDGGSAISSYTVTPYIGSTAQNAQTVTGNPPSVSVSITGLTNGTAYIFTVSATNAVGTSSASAASSAATPVTLPAAPSAVTATAGNASATVSWAAPDGGGSPITSYTVTPYIGTVAQSAKTVTGNPPAGTTTFSGLTNGTAYTFTVSATTSVGTSAASSPSTAVTPRAPTAPATPSGVAATAGVASAVVTWTAPADGGSPLTRYTVTPYIGSTAQTARITIVSGTPPATTATVSGLTGGATYTFRVTATNAIGTSSPSTASPAVTVAAVPGAPTGVSATAGNSTATVSWTAPSSTGGSPITGFTVTPYIGSTAQTSVAATGTSIAVPGLTNGTTYTFRVAAKNAVGTGANSAASGSVTPSTVPGAPTSVTATVGNASATVSWTAPANGGSTITSYRVTPYVGTTAQTARIVTVNGNPPSTTANITALTNGTTYTFTVTAANIRGAGAASIASAPVTPFVPAFVQQVNARIAAASTITATPGNPIITGNRLVVMVGVKNSTSTTTQSVTDSAGNTYTRVVQSRAADSTEMSVWTAPVANGGGTRPVVTARSNSSAKMAIQLLEYSGLSLAAGSSSIDQFRVATGTATTFNVTAQSGVTPATTGASELAIGFYLDAGSGRALTVGTGYVSRSNISPASDMQFLAEDQITGAAGVVPNATVRTGAGANWIVATVVFKRK